MFLKIQPVIYSLIFLVLLEIMFFKESLFWWVLFSTIFLSFFMIWPFIRKIYFLVAPLLISANSVVFLFLVDSKIEKQIFIGLTVGIYYLTLLGTYRLKFYCKDETARAMLDLGTLTAVFFSFVCGYALFLNYQIEIWTLLVVFCVVIFSVSFPSFYICAISKCKEKKIAHLGKIFEISNAKITFLSLVLAVVTTQIIWGVSFWPFSYLTIGVILLIIFFVLWSIVKSFFLRSFSFKNALIVGIVAGLLITVILATAQWSLIV